jgi:hypothetical protein
MYLLVIIRHTLIPNLSRNKKFILRSFRSLSLNRILIGSKPYNLYTIIQLYITHINTYYILLILQVERASLTLNLYPPGPALRVVLAYQNFYDARFLKHQSHQRTKNLKIYRISLTYEKFLLLPILQNLIKFFLHI